MIAGPNGSGKSTIKSFIESKVSLIWGIYINPDDIEKQIRDQGHLDLIKFDITSTRTEIRTFFEKSVLLRNARLMDCVNHLDYANGKLHFDSIHVNAYLASVIAGFIRQKLLEKQVPFTFETVMSSEDKIEFLKQAKENGYRTYLYYVATIDPEINIHRIRERVRNGGHDVPKDKILSRYTRSLTLLWEAVRHSDRAFIFDNSSLEIELLAEITNGKILEIRSENIPQWFAAAILNKFHNPITSRL